MFSRSDKTEEPSEDAQFASDSGQTNPIIWAVVAGLLAVVGAFLLVQYLNGASDEAATEAVDEPTSLVLVVTQEIPKGTQVSEILAAPATYFVSRDMPTRFLADSAIASVQDLREFDGFVFAEKVLPGDQLRAERIVEPLELDNFIDRVAAVSAPDGHHAIVLNLSADRALGGNLRPGDNVTLNAVFRVQPAERDPFNLALVVLPTVEIMNVETSAEFIGEVATADDIGRATVGDFAITLAVKPDEMTDLVYAMEYGQITLAVALPESTDRDDRAFSTIETILSGADFFTDNSGVDFILGNLVDPEELAEILGVDDGLAVERLEEGLTAEELDDSGADDGGGVEASPASADTGSNEAPSRSGDEDVVPPASTSDEPAPAGPGETVDQQAPVDDSSGNGALPPGN